MTEPTDAELWQLYMTMPGASVGKYADPIDFVRAVESEVRKQDDALIRNFVDAIKLDRHDWEDWPEDSRKAFEALINALPFDS